MTEVTEVMTEVWHRRKHASPDFRASVKKVTEVDATEASKQLKITNAFRFHFRHFDSPLKREGTEASVPSPLLEPAAVAWKSRT
jgi:predicted secreted protein